MKVLATSMPAAACLALLSCAEVYEVTDVLPPEPPEPPPGYEEVHDACASVLEDAPDNYSHNRFWTFVSQECAEVLGLAFGFDWASFDEEAHEFHKAETPGEIVIGGLVMAIGDSGVPVADVLGAEAPAVLAEEMAWIADGGDFEDDSGRLWFEFLQSTIAWIEYAPSNDYAMAYHRSSGGVSVGDITDVIPPEGFPDENPFWVHSSYNAVLRISGCLVHEGSHAFYDGHGSCEGEAEAGSQCDPTPDGAYGSGVWWAYQWLLHNLDFVDDQTCYEAADAAGDWCEHINAIDDWPACVDFTLCL